MKQLVSYYLPMVTIFALGRDQKNNKRIVKPTYHKGRLIGKRGQGRKRCTFLHRLKSGEDYGILKRRAEDRDRWRNWKPV